MNSEQEVLISVIVPVYNVEQYLATCVESLVNQSIHGIEIILVDDGSTDQSGEMCDRFAEQYSNIAVVHRENGGLGFARNSGLEVAQGIYVGFVDSDDFVHCEMFEILYKNALKYNADASYGVWKRFTDQTQINQYEEIEKTDLQVWDGENEIHCYLLDRIGLSPNEVKDNLYGASVCGGIFKRSIIEENNIHFVSERQYIAEDMIFDIDFIMCCAKVVHCNDKLYYYRYNPASLTTTYKVNRFRENVILYDEMCHRMAKKYDKNESFNSLSRYFLTFTRVSIIQEIVHIRHNGYLHAKKNVKEICNNQELQNILQKYDYKKLPYKYRILCWAEKRKYIDLLLLITYFVQRVRRK